MPISTRNEKIKQEVVLVTGLSGAGRSTCLNILEDYGFEAVDNIPLNFIPALLANGSSQSTANKNLKIAIGIDARTRNFDETTLLEYASQIKSSDHLVSIVFVDCADETLIKRFTETRRKHPLSNGLPIIDGIKLERQLLTDIRTKSDLLIDTTGLSISDLSLILSRRLGLKNTSKLTLSLLSFGFRNGLPAEADTILDVRFLSNPHYNEQLRPLDGRNKEIAAFIENDPRFSIFFNGFKNFLDPLLPFYADEGKSYLTIAIGCTGGKHRSVFVAERLNNWLKQREFIVNLRHRDLIE
ncbi:RNase adapter RapZ [Alphaproteobacteria bacterium]|jgi:RNase adapter protein RapZ|nr:RNase adapter RapZ [Rhodospirillaceae bacterium]MDC0997815.1 RNase adapter RapZ [Alphaproteobacteria bacterium]